MKKEAFKIRWFIYAALSIAGGFVGSHLWPGPYIPSGDRITFEARVSIVISDIMPPFWAIYPMNGSGEVRCRDVRASYREKALGQIIDNGIYRVTLPAGIDLPTAKDAVDVRGACILETITK